MAGAVTVREALAAWLEHLAHERRASPRTVRAYGDNVGAYLAFLEQHRGGALPLSEMSEVAAADLRAYLAHRRSGERPLSPRSVSQSLSSIRAFHRFLDRRLDTPNAAVCLVRGPRVPAGVPRPVSEDQARGLIEEASFDPDRDDWQGTRDAALITLLWGCGLRISEALSLKRGDVPLGESIRITGKGGKTRIVPVLPAVAEAIEAYVTELPIPPRAGGAALPRRCAAARSARVRSRP